MTKKQNKQKYLQFPDLYTVVSTELWRVFHQVVAFPFIPVYKDFLIGIFSLYFLSISNHLTIVCRGSNSSLMKILIFSSYLNRELLLTPNV